MLGIMLPRSYRQMIHRRLPIVEWLPRYTLEDALSDLVAGITVGLTLMPQALAYASLAGLQSQYGLYSAFAGSFVYILLGTCKEVNIGPTALISLLTSSYTYGTNPDMAVLLCFLSGCVELLCGILHLGFLVEFVSVPVVAGFTSAAALIIASSQIKGLLGLKFDAEGFLETWMLIVENIHKYNLGDVILGACCIILLLSLRKLKDINIPFDEGNPKAGRKKALKKILWFISTGRNAMVVIACAAIAYIFKQNGDVPFALAGNIVPGLPPVGLPPFYTTFGNQTYTFTEMCAYLSSGIAVVPIVSILGNVAIAKAFSSGAMVDATQEMVTLGLCNIVGSFFRSMPVTGSFSRSAVNNASGVRTQMGGLYTGILVILALSLLTPYFYFIPKATLSSVIICAVVFMVEVGIVIPIWRSNKRDLIPAFATFLACLWLGVEIGIVIGIAVDIAFLLYFNARPRVLVEKVTISGGLEYILVTPSAGLLFPAVDFVREAVAKASNPEDEEGANLTVVVNCKHMHRADFTAAQGIQALIQDFRKRNRHVVFHSLKSDVAKILKGVCPSEFLYSSTEAGLIQILKGLQSSHEENKLESLKIEGNIIAAQEPVLNDTRI
ncbi:sodium-independent sulfate anion transporter [Anabrus simplex]|uniref:sodium-independent sulfate anion transporter n=1 Tax=Anabrus simplex TaxID=316456 RepID=UPI0035A28D98